MCAEKRSKPVEQLGQMAIQIACAIDENGRFKRLGNGRFFAFLPTEQTTALGFHLQANFVPTASRENIDQDRTDNKLILQFAGRCLVEKVCKWRDEGKHDIDLYELLPLEREATGIDSLVAAQVKLHATKERLIFTRGSEWRYPSNAIYLAKSHRPLLNLLNVSDLTHHYKIPADFVHESVTGRALEVIKSLGVNTFELSNLIEILEDQEWLAQKLPDYDWFSDLFSFLYGIREEIRKNGFLERLKSLLIVPGEHGYLAAPGVPGSGQQLYLPVETDTEVSYKLFGSRLNLVSQALLKASETKGNSETVLGFLKWMGVESIEPCWVISDIILPIFERDDWPQLDEALHFEYLDFIRRHWQKYLDQAQQSNSKAAVKKRTGEALRFKCQSQPDKYSPISQLILSAVYKPNGNLEAILAGVPTMDLVSSNYDEQEKEAKKRQAFTGASWCDFLCDLGILQFSSTERIISLLENIDWLSQKSFEDFCDLFIFLLSINRSIEVKLDQLEKLKSIPLVPVTSLTQKRPLSGARLLEASKYLYLPLTGEADASYTLFGQYLSLIDRDLLNTINIRDDKEKIYDFFKWLEIVPIEFYWVVNNLILPIFQGDEWKEIDGELHFDYLNFIRIHWEEYRKKAFRENGSEKDVMESVSQALLFQCHSDPTQYNRAPQLLLPEGYNPGDKLESLLVGIPGFNTVSPFYLEAEEHERNTGGFSGPSWCNFLCELGALESSDTKRIVEVLDDNLDWVTKRPCSWLGNLFSFLYDLREDIESSRLLRQLKELPIIPSDTGEFLAAIPQRSNQRIFLPLTDGPDSYTLFQGHFNLVAQELLELRDNQGKILAFLKWLGIRPLEAFSAIEEIILPVFEGGEWQQLDENTHFAYLDFIRRHWRSYLAKVNEPEKSEEIISRVSKTLRFRCRSANKYDLAPNLLLSQAYKPDHDLEFLLADTPNMEFINDVYAEQEKQIGKTKRSNELSWRRFLCELGVVCRLEVVKVIELLNDQEWVAQKAHTWFCKIFVFLYDNHILEQEGLIDKLKSISIVPTTRDGLQAALGQRLYLPVENEVEKSYLLFGNYLKLVDKELFKAAQSTGDSEKIVEFLKWLDIQPFEPYFAIRDVIVPLFEGDKWKEVETELHFEYLDFVRRYWWTYRERARQIDSEENAVEKVKRVLRLKCHSVPDKYNLVPELLLSQVYMPDDDLESLLEDVPGMDFVNEYYYDQERQSRETKSFTGPSWGVFLRDLSVVYQFELIRIVDDFVLPQFRNEAWKKDRSWFALTDFIRRNLAAYEGSNTDLDKLKSQLWIAPMRERDGVWYFNRSNNLYLSLTYHENLDVAVAFGNLLINQYVSDKYLEYSTQGKNKEEQRELRRSWGAFFGRIGLRRYVPLQENVWDPLFDQFFAELSGLQKVDQRQKRARAFLRMLNRYWQDVYQQIVENNSDLFVSHLKQYAWIPTQGNTLVYLGTKLFDRKLEPLVVDPERICAEAISSPVLQKLLNIQTELTLSDTLELLIEARQRDETANFKQVRELYNWLQSYLDRTNDTENQQTIQQEFDSHNLIYLPNPTNSSSWAGPYCCFWEPAPYKFIDNYRPVLSRTYDGLRQFFVDGLNVRMCADESDCLSVLVDDITAENKPGAETFDEIFRLYLEIQKKLQAGDAEIFSAITPYHDAPIWLCEDGILRSKAEVYINDHPQLYQLFKEISYIWFAPGYPVSAWTNLISEFGLSRLSEVQSDIIGYQISPNDEISEEWKEGLSRLIDSLVQYLFTHEYSKCRQMWEAGTIDQLYALNLVATLDSIPVQYRLPHGEVACDNQKVYADLREGSLYIAHNLKLKDLSLSREICRAIGVGREIQNFVTSLLPYLDDGEEFTEFIKQQELFPLPEVKTRIQSWKVDLEGKGEDNESVPSTSDTFDAVPTNEEPEEQGVTSEQESEDDDTSLPSKPSTESKSNGSESRTDVTGKKEGNIEYRPISTERNVEPASSDRSSKPEVRTSEHTPRGDKPKHDDNERQTSGRENRRPALQPSESRITDPNVNVKKEPKIPEPSGQKDWQPECNPQEANIQYKRFEDRHEKPKKRKQQPGSQPDPLPPSSSHSNNSSRNQDTDSLSPQARKDIGRWGEELAVKHLVQTNADQSFVVEETNFGFVIKFKGEVTAEIYWLNKNGEAGKSCDIIVMRERIKIFYEVKSTKTVSKEWFDISAGEWDLAQEAGEKFCILCVHNAGSKGHATITEICNPYKLWKEGRLAAKPVRIEL